VGLAVVWITCCLLLAELLQQLFWGLDAWRLLGCLDGLSGVLGSGWPSVWSWFWLSAFFVGGVAVVRGFFGDGVLLLNLERG